MKAILPLVALVLSCVACTSTYRADGARGALARRDVARIVVDPDDSGDALCRRAVERELRARGFQMATNGRTGLDVKMIDTWRWDIVMYLLELDLIFTDAATGAMKAQAHYRNSPLHGFPSQSDVVVKLFKELEARGVFAK